MALVDEPIVESAPLARWLAPRLCYKDPATGEDCSWAHGFWQYLRIMGLVTTPEHHADFFRDAFKTAAGDGNRISVLVSGAMDYSMLAHALWACRLHGAVPDITVVDVCDTSLFLNHWYARRAGIRIQTFRSNILDFETTATYNVVCTHSFLGSFSAPQRRELMVKWLKLLKPGGRAITVKRVRRQSGKGKVGFSTEQAQALRDTVLRKFESLREQLGLEQSELEQHVEAYTTRHRTHPVGDSPEDIGELFKLGGFELEHLSCAPVTAPGREQVSGPTTPGGAEYAHIIARRPHGPS